MATIEDRDAAPPRRRSNRLFILLSLTIILLAVLQYNGWAWIRLWDRAAFGSQVRAHFDEWDLDHDGTLSPGETATLVPNDQIRDEAAAALATIHHFQRTRKTRWSNASFRREELIGASLRGLLEVDSPPFSIAYAWTLSRIRSAGRTLFAEAAPGLGGIHQGYHGDCYLISTTGALLTRQPEALRALFSTGRDGGYTVRFPGGPAVSVASVSDAEIALGSTAGSQGIWINVLEKAFGEIVESRRRTSAPAADDLYGSGTQSQVIGLLTGYKGERFDLRDGFEPQQDSQSLIDLVRKILRTTRPPSCLTTCETPDSAVPPGLVPYHAYAVLGFDDAGDKVHVWNPHGNDFAPSGPPGIGSGYLVRQGHFHVPLSEFVQIFAGISCETGSRVADRIEPASGSG